MGIKARPFGFQEKIDWGADIHSVAYDGRLVIGVKRSRNENGVIRITFNQVDGFRLLDEVQLAHYWVREDFPLGYPLLEVIEDGWANEEDERLGYVQQQREWMIVTAGACVSVFSKAEPEVIIEI